MPVGAVSVKIYCSRISFLFRLETTSALQKFFNSLFDADFKSIFPVISGFPNRWSTQFSSMGLKKYCGVLDASSLSASMSSEKR
jgi:hypothetical protein